MRSDRILLLVVTFMLSAPFAFTQCALEHWSLQKRVEHSDLIVEGRIMAKQSVWDSDHQNIYTLNTIEVYRLFKGSIQSDTIKVVTLGGTVGLERHTAYPSLQLDVFEIGVLMLKNNTLKINDKAPLYEPSASAHSFIKYDLYEVRAYDIDQLYYSISYDLYQDIQQYTGREIQELSDFDPESKRKGVRPIANPVISSIDLDTVSAGTGTLLTITGSNFGIIRGNGKVGFKNADYGDGRYYYPPITESYASWSNSKIQVYVPTKAGTGKIQVITNFGDVGESSFDLNVKWAHSNVIYFNSQVDTQLYETQHVDLNGKGGYTWQMTTQFSSNTSAVNSFMRAMESWRCGSKINWIIGEDTTLDQTSDDGINIIRFDDLADNKLGVCWSRWSGCYNNTLGIYQWFVNELDIEFDSLYDWYYGTGTPTSNQMDFQSVAAHELGHGHQLSHVRDATKMMHYSIAPGEQKSDLHTFDLEGAGYVMHKDTSTAICKYGSVKALTISNCNITLPKVTFSLSDTVVCPGDSVTMANETTGNNLNFSWDFGNGYGSSNEGPHKVAFDSSGNKTVRLIVTNSFGSDTSTRQILVLPAVPASPLEIIGNDTGCLGQNYYSVDSVLNATNYAWAIPNGGGFIGSSLGRSVKVNWTDTGTRTLRVVSLGECGNSSPTIDTVFVQDEVISDFEWTADGLQVTFNATSTAAEEYSWDFGDGQGSALSNPVHNFPDKGTYTVRLVSVNSCGSDTVEYTMELSFRLGINDLKTRALIYPNPAAEGAVVTLLVGEGSRYAVLDMEGRLVHNGEIHLNAVTLPKLSAGLYVVRVDQQGSSGVYRLVIVP